jgi:hypothetical protein
MLVQDKTFPKKVIHPTNDVLLLSDEAPGKHRVSKLLRVTMEELWEVLFDCKLAKKKGSHNVIDKQQIKKFTQDNGLADVLVDGKSNKQPLIRLGFAQDDLPAADQWKG